MPKKDRTRIDYMSGKAAFDALALSSEMFLNMRPQALIDKLVIAGLVALHWEPSRLYGTDRDHWKLPEFKVLNFRCERQDFKLTGAYIRTKTSRVNKCFCAIPDTGKNR
jgi:hypothetical protein